MEINLEELHRQITGIGEEVSGLGKQIAYLTVLMETDIGERTPCPEKNKDNMKAVLELLQNSPLSKHPVFKDAMAPLEKLFEGK